MDQSNIVLNKLNTANFFNNTALRAEINHQELNNKIIVMRENDEVSNGPSICNMSFQEGNDKNKTIGKKEEEGFREALRKVNSKNDKMDELMKIDKLHTDTNLEDSVVQADQSIISIGDALHYTDGNREYMSNSRTDFEKDLGSELSNNLRVFKNFKNNDNTKKDETVMDKKTSSDSKTPILRKLKGN